MNLGSRDSDEVIGNAKRLQIDSFWNSMNLEERKQAEAVALSQVDPTQDALIKKGGIVARSVRKNLFDEYALHEMAK